ncbi:MAG TPA: pilus assembly protein N-terminal domain-containing protein [Xanthobacteraceae bacterium]|jgi:hypothetical protein
MASLFARFVVAGVLALPAAAAVAPGSPLAADLTVILDQARVIRLPEKAATVVVGNPLIADVSLQPGGLMVVTGKGYGTTNLIAVDRAGNELMHRSIEVQGPRARVVTVYRGIDRESYSCTPRCERRITLGDSHTYFEAAIAQTASRNGLAQGQGTAAPAAK